MAEADGNEELRDGARSKGFAFVPEPPDGGLGAAGWWKEIVPAATGW